MRAGHRISLSTTIAGALLFAGIAGEGHAAKVTECMKTGVCYCVNDELKATIADKSRRISEADCRAAQRRQGGGLSEYVDATR